MGVSSLTGCRRAPFKSWRRLQLFERCLRVLESRWELGASDLQRLIVALRLEMSWASWGLVVASSHVVMKEWGRVRRQKVTSEEKGGRESEMSAILI